MGAQTRTHFEVIGKVLSRHFIKLFESIKEFLDHYGDNCVIDNAYIYPISDNELNKIEKLKEEMERLDNDRKEKKEDK